MNEVIENTCVKKESVEGLGKGFHHHHHVPEGLGVFPVP